MDSPELLPFYILMPLQNHKGSVYSDGAYGVCTGIPGHQLIMVKACRFFYTEIMRVSHQNGSSKVSFSSYLTPLLIIGTITVFFAISSFISSNRLERNNIQKYLSSMDVTARLELQLVIARAFEASVNLVHEEELIRWFSGDTNPLLKELALDELGALIGPDRFDTSFAARKDTEEFYVGSRLIEKLSIHDPDDSWFYESLSMKEPITLNVDHNRELNKTLLWINAQIKNDRGEVIGIAGIGMNIDSIQEKLKKLVPGRTGTILFADETGKIKLAYPIDYVHADLDEILEPPSVIEISLTERDSVNFNRNHTVYTRSRMSDLGLTVVIMAQVEDFLSPFMKITRLSTLLNFLLIFIQALFFVRIIMKLRNTIIRQNKSQEVTILSMSLLAELKDQETGNHINRTKKYCRLLAEELKSHREYSEYLTDSYIADLERSAPLHDIGKVGIPDSILLKPGKLTEEEFEVIKTHPVMGARVLQSAMDQLDVTSFLTIGVQLVRHHHEKWDGSGYPDGLAGKHIPLSARIMAIADVYDALRTKRPYKEAFTHEESLQIIKKGSGYHFQPLLVDAFLKREEEFRKISSEWDD